MSTPLDGIVTRPTSFDPAKDYALVIGRRDERLGDYDLNDLQEILRHDLAELMRLLLKEGLVEEAGGTVSAPEPGVVLGDDALGAAGTYVGLESQVYTVRIVTGGPGGLATYTWESTGSDGPTFAGNVQPVTAVAPDVATGLADLATYGHAVGRHGVVVVFANPTLSLVGGNSWVVGVAYGATLPSVAGNTITIPDLTVHMRGRLHRAAGVTLTYPVASSGVATVYVEFTRTLVTDVDDPDLRDPESSTPQAWRQRWTCTITNVDSSAVPLAGGPILERRVLPIYRWDRATDVVERVQQNVYAVNIGRAEGALDARRLLSVELSEPLRGQFAERDRGAHGSYVIQPLAPEPRAVRSAQAATPGKLRLTVPPIVASVEGVLVKRTTPAEIELDLATDTGQVVGETHVYTPAADPILLAKAAAFPSFPIAQVTRLTATVQVGVFSLPGYEAVTRGAGSFDSFAQTNLQKIVVVSNDDGGPGHYGTGTHYRQVGNQIEWLGTPGVDAPATGATYYVVYQYRKLLTVNVDFQVTSTGGLTFANQPGTPPVAHSVLEVDYLYVLPRTDVLLLRPTGALEVLRGLPAEEPTVPTAPRLTLPYAHVRVPAGGEELRIAPAPNERISMVDLNLLILAMDEVTRNVARLDLAAQARSMTQGDLLDILVEAFTSESIADFTFDRNGVAFDATIDLVAGELTLPADQALATPGMVAGVPIAPGQAAADVRVGAAWWTLPFTHELEIDTGTYSEVYPVNPYADFRPEPPALALIPPQDLWLDARSTTPTKARTLEHGRSPDERGTTLAARVRAAETSGAFMRPITLRIEGSHFVPTERVTVRFAGIQVLTLAPQAPGNGTPEPRFVQVDAHGDWAAEFGVPIGVPSGAALVEVFGDSAQVGAVYPGDFALRATAVFRSSAGFREEAIDVTVRVEDPGFTALPAPAPPARVQNTPVAQSFAFPSPRMVSRIELPFTRRDPAVAPGSPLVLELCATTRAGRASTPDDRVLARMTRAASQIPTSPFTWTLPDPVIMPADEFRALVLRSASPEWRIYVARLGGPDKVAGGFVAKQRIESGVFMESSNGADWTLKQDFDLRCKVFCLRTTGLVAVLHLATITEPDATSFMVVPDQVVPEGTSIEWQYATDGLPLGTPGKVWTTCLPYRLVELATPTAALDVRALLRTTNDRVTPAIHRRNLVVHVRRNRATGTYVSRRKVLTAPTQRVAGDVELRTPAAASQAVYVSVDDGVTWTAATLGAPRSAAGGFVAYPFEATGFSPGTNLRLRITQTTTAIAARPRARSLYGFAEPIP